MAVFVAGKLMAFAFAEAATIAWWTGAMKGRTLKELHHDWDAGRSVVAVAKNPLLFNWICLGSIAFTAFAGLGTVLQKATSTYSKVDTYPQSMSASLAVDHPLGWSGAYSGLRSSVYLSYATPVMADVVQNFQQRNPIHLDLSGCENNSNVTCAATLEGLGFEYDCEASQKYQEMFDGIGSTFNDIFNVTVGFNMSSAWHLDISVLFKDKTACNGDVSIRKCVLRPAVVQYPVVVKQGIATLAKPTTQLSWSQGGDLVENQVAIDSVVKKLPWRPLPGGSEWENQLNPIAVASHTPSTLGGLWLTFNSMFTSSVELNFIGIGWQSAFTGSIFPMGYQNWNSTAGEECSSTFSDPIPAMINNIREIMFRSSVALGRNQIADDPDYVSSHEFSLSLNASSYATNDGSPSSAYAALNATGAAYRAANPPVTTVSDDNAKYDFVHVVYRTNFLFLWLGVGLMLAAVASTLPLFWGYWKLGRKVTLSPLEMAKALHTSHKSAKEKLAFDGSNAEAEELIRAVGDMKVKYGEVAPQRLGLGFVDQVHAPVKGQTYR